MPAPDSLDAQVAVLKGWVWHERYRSIVPSATTTEVWSVVESWWSDPYGHMRDLPRWETERWPELLWDLQAMNPPWQWQLQRHDGYRWLCWCPQHGMLTVFFSLKDNPGGCVCEAWIAVKGKETNDG